MSLQDLYQQLILDHARERHGQGLREASAGDVAEGRVVAENLQVNPLCGDEVMVRVALTPGEAGSPVIEDLSWAGEGCSISQAATSVLHDLVVGRPVDEAMTLLDAYRQMIRSRGQSEPDEELLGDAVAFAGVGRHANRVKCAMLGWMAFEAALSQASGAVGQDRARQQGTREVAG
jgi:nitrogen fixation protein NifU and related proteins